MLLFLDYYGSGVMHQSYCCGLSIAQISVVSVPRNFEKSCNVMLFKYFYLGEGYNSHSASLFHEFAVKFLQREFGLGNFYHKKELFPFT